MSLKPPQKPRHSALLRDLAEPGCPACRRGAWSEDRYEFGFIYEHHGDRYTLAHLRASLGFCAAHTRRLLRRHEAQWVMPLVYAEVVRAAREDLGPRSTAPAVRPCPMCESQGQVAGAFLRALVVALRDPHVAETYEKSDGLCLPHLCNALRDRDHTATVVLVRAFGTRLRQATDPGLVLRCLAGRDDDRPARHDQRLRLQRVAVANAAPAPVDVLGGLRDRFGTDACPICLVGALAEAQFLTWLATEFLTSASSLTVEGLWLCPGHLHDLADLNAASGAAVARHQQEEVGAELARLEARLQTLPPAGPLARVLFVRALLRDREAPPRRRWAELRRGAAALVASRRSSVAASLEPLTRPRRCAACSAWVTAEERVGSLLGAAIEDGQTARVYEGSHGICVRHAYQLKGHPWAGPVVAVLRARLAVLGWELDEIRRKSAWAERWDATGPESGAWLRAPGHLDGRVFLGAPAPASWTLL